jgi:hypothetical protein
MKSLMNSCFVVLTMTLAFTGKASARDWCDETAGQAAVAVESVASAGAVVEVLETFPVEGEDGTQTFRVSLHVRAESYEDSVAYQVITLPRGGYCLIKKVELEM